MKKILYLVVCVGILFSIYKIAKYRQNYNLLLKWVNCDAFLETPEYELAKEVQRGRIKLIKELCHRNPTFIQKSYSQKGYSVLHFACRLGNKKSVNALLESGFNPNALTETDLTPMHFLFYNIDYSVAMGKKVRNRKEILKLLLEHGADCNIPCKGDEIEYSGVTDDGVTPLIRACADGSLECVKLMIERGNGDVNRETKNRMTAAVNSLYFGYFNQAYYLICNHKAKVTSSFKPREFECSTTYLLRNQIFPLNSKKYKMKKEIIQELKNQGIDYYSEPIPDDVLDKIKELYPNTWEEYIKEY